MTSRAISSRLAEAGRAYEESLAVRNWVERFDRRGIESFELFRPEFGQNSWNRKKTTKNHFIEVACDPKYKKGP